MAAITPEQLAAAGTEHAHQAALFCWANERARNVASYAGLAFLFAIPNGGARSGVTAARMKAEGVKAGVPDICLPMTRGGYAGLYIELKRPKAAGKMAGRLSPEQADWHAFLRVQGYAVAVAYGWRAAVAVIEAYLDGGHITPEYRAD